jgi:Ca2+/Na+ antiporter
MLENLLNSISSNPAYLAVTIVLMAMIAFSVVKRLFKLVTLGITLLILYYAYIMLTGQPLPDINLDKIQEELEEVTGQAKEFKDKAGDTLEKANDTLEKFKDEQK